MKSPTVLIVDSNPRDLAKHAAILKEARYAVLQATGCAEAAGILARHRGKIVVLSDLRIGEECGLEFLCDTMRKYPFLPFTFLASSPPLDSVIEALKRAGVRFSPQARRARHPPALRRAVGAEALPDHRDGEAGKRDPHAPRPQPGGPERRANPIVVQGVHDLDGGARLPVDSSPYWTRTFRC